MANSRIQSFIFYFLARVQCIAFLVQGIRVLKSYNKTRNFAFSPKFLYNFDYAIYKLLKCSSFYSVQYKHSAQSRHSALTLTFLKHWELLNVSEKKNTRQLNIYSNIKCPRCFPSVTLMRRPTIVAFVENNRLACAVLLLSTETAAVLFLRSISTLKRGQLILQHYCLRSWKRHRR